MSTVWNRDPDDGVRCLLSTRRVLDRWGFCCDYNRCRVYETDESGKVIERCMRYTNHKGSCRVHTSYDRAPKRPWRPTGNEPITVGLLARGWRLR